MWKQAIKQTLPFWILLAVLWFMAEFLDQSAELLKPNPASRAAETTQ